MQLLYYLSLVTKTIKRPVVVQLQTSSFLADTLSESPGCLCHRRRSLVRCIDCELHARSAFLGAFCESVFLVLSQFVSEFTRVGTSLSFISFLGVEAEESDMSAGRSRAHHSTSGLQSDSGCRIRRFWDVLQQDRLREGGPAVHFCRAGGWHPGESEGTTK